AARRGEREVVAMDGRDVVVATQRPEVVALVAIHRLLVAHPLPDRMGIGVDLDVVRIPIEGVGHGGHWRSIRPTTSLATSISDPASAPRSDATAATMSTSLRRRLPASAPISGSVRADMMASP